MMRVLVVSDSHGSMRNLQEVIRKTKKIDMLIHLGDIQGDEEVLRSLCDYPVNIVRGNCDFASQSELFMVITLEKHKIFATHGHVFGVNWGIEKLSQTALDHGCDIAMYGHTHIPEIIRGDDLTVINPGSISRPRQYDHRPSYIIMELLDNGDVFYNMNYLEKEI